MKKLICAVLCVLLTAGLCACGEGVDNAASHDVDSDIYSPEEINAAISVIKEEFESSWKGCTLTEIYYAGDESSLAHQDWADRENADQAIVLTSSFDVDASGGDGSLNPDSTYDNWSWILVRSDGGSWRHVDHGY